MKIIQIITLGDIIAGAQKHVLDISIELQKKGNRVVVLVGKGGLLNEQLEEEGIEVITLKNLQRAINPKKDIAAYFELAQILKSLQPDIVAAHSSKAGILSRLVCRQLNIPNTFTVHGWSFADGIPFVRRALFLTIEKIIGFFSDQLFTVSEADRQLGLKYGIVPSDKMVTIHNGVRDTQSAPIERTENGKVRLCMVARFQAQKDHKSLLTALGNLKDLNWELELLGSGPLMEEMKELAMTKGIADRIFFRGEVSNVYDHLRSVDCFCLITNWEGFPLSILEAMAHQLPIIASNVGGVNESVKDDYTGLLVERGNVAEVTASLRKVISNGEFRAQLGKNSRRFFEQNFTTKAMVDKLSFYYQRLAARKTTQPVLDLRPGLRVIQKAKARA